MSVVAGGLVAAPFGRSAGGWSVVLAGLGSLLLVIGAAVLFALVGFRDVRCSDRARITYRRCRVFAIASAAVGAVLFASWGAVTGAPSWIPALFIGGGCACLGAVIVATPSLQRSLPRSYDTVKGSARPAAIAIAFGSLTILLQGPGLVIGGPGSYGLTPSEAISELGFRPIGVTGSWVLYGVALVVLTAYLGRRRIMASPAKAPLVTVEAALWTLGAVGGPWVIVVGAAWGPLYDEHHGARNEGASLVLAVIATEWWYLTVVCLVGACVVSLAALRHHRLFQGAIDRA